MGGEGPMTEIDITERLRHPDLFNLGTDHEYQLEVAGSAANEIEGLREDLERATRLVREANEVLDAKDRRIVQMESDQCVMENILAHIKSVLEDNDGALSYEEAHEIALEHAKRFPQISSDRLYVELAEANRRTEELEAAIFWACGVNGTFPPRQDGEGAYWWRTELRERAGISSEELNRRAILEVSDE
jgi:hypothetical protein